MRVVPDVAPESREGLGGHSRGAVPTLRDVGPGRTLASSDKWRIVAACG